MSAAAARALASMSREEAIEILNRMPYLVCMSSYKLLQSQIRGDPRRSTRRSEVYWVEFMVSDSRRSYTFERQPFHILCAISKEEFKRAAPWASVTGGKSPQYFYRISTD